MIITTFVSEVVIQPPLNLHFYLFFSAEVVNTLFITELLLNSSNRFCVPEIYEYHYEMSCLSLPLASGSTITEKQPSNSFCFFFHLQSFSKV